MNIKDFKKWSRKEKFAYLQMRGIYLNSRSLKSELFEMVKVSKDLPAKKIFEPFSGTDMRQMVLVLNSFLSALFSMDLTGEKAKNRLSSIARMYLCCSSRLDQFLLKKNPSWLSTFSLLGMLRVTDTFILHHTQYAFMREIAWEKALSRKYAQFFSLVSGRDGLQQVKVPIIG